MMSPPTNAVMPGVSGQNVLVSRSALGGDAIDTYHGVGGLIMDVYDTL